MLLRRFTRHVKEQNWLAVFLDFLIVIAGVFLGVQLSNFNANIAERRAEKEILAELYREVALSKAELETQIEEYRGRIEYYRDAMPRLYGENPTGFVDDDCNGLVGRSLIYDVVPRFSAVQELVETGQLSRLSNEAVKSAITGYRDYVQFADKRQAVYLAQIEEPNRAFPDIVQLIPYWEEESESIRIRMTCNFDRAIENPAFMNAVARNFDMMEAWTRQFQRDSYEEVSALKTALEQGLSPNVTK